jgi:hypothetical protein
MSMIGNLVRISSAQLDALLQAPHQITDFLYSEKYQDNPASEHLDIDKTWQIIHFLLTGDPWKGEYPLGAVVLGGTELGEEDVGYGPARFLRSDEVREVAEALGSISETELWERFSEERAAKADIYPQGWTNNDSEYVLGNFTALKRFYSTASQAKQAVLQFIN